MYNLPKFSPSTAQFLCALIMFIFTNSPQTGYAQGQFFCHAGGGANAIGALTGGSSDELSKGANGPFYIKVYIHALGDDLGQDKPNYEQINTSFEIMKSAFSEHNIFFVWDCSVIPLHSSYLYEWDNISGLCGIEKYYLPHQDGIDLIIGGDQAPAYAAASGIPGKIILIKGTEIIGPPGNQTAYSSSRSLVIAHEMGHCLGLWHTFHGGENALDCNWNDIEEECPEFVNGANSATCGDYVVDTPAEPFPPFNPHSAYLSNCVYYYNNLDPNGALYKPNTHLIMSNSYVGCMTHHTSGQGARMREIITISPILQACLISSDLMDISINSNTNWTAANTPNKGDFFILENLTIQDGATLTIASDVHIRFGENSKLIIMPNGVLNLYGSLSAMACSNTWEGIQVWGSGPDKSQYEVNGKTAQGRLICQEGALIENAQTAVQLYGPTKAFAGGQISCSSTKFRNNVIGIDVAPYSNFWPFDPATSPQNNPRDYSGSLDRCIFYNDDSFPHEAPFQAFIQMTGINGVKIQGTSFLNDKTVEGSTIADWGYGIWAIDAGFTLQESVAEDKSAQGAMLYSEFRGLGYGIQVQKNGSNRPYTVTHTNFNRCFVGIRSWAVNGASIVNNSFNLGDLPNNKATQDQVGLIFEAEAAGFTLEENKFSRIPGSNGITTIGTICLNTGEQNKRIRRNTYTRLHIGNLANQQNATVTNSQQEPLARGLFYECNAHINTELNNTINISIPNGQVRSMQGLEILKASTQAEYVAAGNQFSNSGGVGFANFGTPVQYFYDPSGAQSKPLGIQGLLTVQEVNSNTCAINYCLPPCLNADELSKLKLDFYSNSALATDFKTNMGSNPSQNQLVTLAYYQRVLDEQAYAIALQHQSDSSSFQVDSLLVWIANMNSLEGDLWLSNQYLSMENHTKALDLLIAMPTKFKLSTAQQTDIRFFRDISNLLNGKNIYQLDAPTLQALKFYTTGPDGFAKGWARRLLTPYGWNFAPEYVKYGAGTLSNAEPEQPEPDPAPAIQVYPNPASDQVTFAFPSEIQTGKAMLRISDVNGRLIANSDLQISDSKINWNTGSIASGIYFYQLFTSSANFSGKIVIRH